MTRLQGSNEEAVAGVVQPGSLKEAKHLLKSTRCAWTLSSAPNAGLAFATACRLLSFKWYDEKEIALMSKPSIQCLHEAAQWNALYERHGSRPMFPLQSKAALRQPNRNKWCHNS